MFKLLVLINKMGLPAVSTQVIDFKFVEEANRAAELIEKRATDYVNLIVIKLY